MMMMIVTICEIVGSYEAPAPDTLSSVQSILEDDHRITTLPLIRASIPFHYHSVHLSIRPSIPISVVPVSMPKKKLQSSSRTAKSAVS